MQTIHELLSRIRWDPEFGRGRFELGYWDRVEKRVVKIELESPESAPEGDSFTITDEEGRFRSVPLHRIRCVWKDGDLIWSRDCSGSSSGE